MKLDGAVALVTGGASGLGAATLRRLVAGGARAVIVDRDETKGQALAAELEDRAVFVKADVTDAPSIEEAIARAAQLGPLRVAVSCAGVGWASRTLDRTGKPHDLQLFSTVVGINLIGTFNVLRFAAQSMIGNEPDANAERGVCINTASIAAFDGQVGQVAYSASKGGVVGMTLPVARDLAQYGVRVVTIAPGLFDTQLLAALPEEARTKLGESIPFPPRLGRPEEYAQLAAQIVENTMLNGETIRLDGALRMAPR